MAAGARRGWIGSVVLLLAAATILLRPWEQGLLPADAEPRAARAYVIRAVDGDTIEARIGGRVEDVRYIGVDTPETVKPGTPVQCFGHRASDFTSAWSSIAGCGWSSASSAATSTAACSPTCTSVTGSSTPNSCVGGSRGPWRSRQIPSTERFSGAWS